MALRELFGKSKRKDYDKLLAITIGEDRILVERDIDSTGLNYINGQDLAGYDSSPDSVARVLYGDGDNVKDGGQACILFEPMARPFSFDSLDWVGEDRVSSRAKVLASARSEAESRVVQDLEDEANYDRVSTGFLILVALFAITALLFLLQSGIIQQLIG